MAFLQPFVATCAVLITAQQSADQRKKTEIALRDSEKRMRLALRGAQLGLWGSRFDIYLPRTGEAPSSEPRRRPAPATVASGRILLVEDDEMVRGLTRALLEGAGYSVIEASGAEEAMALENVPGAIDVLVTDLVMPKVNGLELARRLRERRPELRVLVTSGYPDKAGELASTAGQDVVFLTKPFTRESFVSALGDLLP